LSRPAGSKASNLGGKCGANANESTITESGRGIVKPAPLAKVDYLGLSYTFSNRTLGTQKPDRAAPDCR
jgi:hypothetical protein